MPATGFTEFGSTGTQGEPLTVCQPLAWAFRYGHKTDMVLALGVLMG